MSAKREGHPMCAHFRNGFAAAIALVTVAVVCLFPGVASASGVQITGAGSTWSKNAIDQWRADVAADGLSVAYNGVGSTSGRSFYLQGQVDFAVSEIPFQPTEMAAARQVDYQYLPIVAGGTSLMYNLYSSTGQQIRDLKLTAPTIALIFTGKISYWDDARITKDYGKKLPHTRIVPVVRSDGSGTSAQFSAWIDFMEPSIWAAFARQERIPPSFTSQWPTDYGNAIGQNGSDGVANYVANKGQGVGAIGYVEYSYALLRGYPVVSVKNKAGNFAQPTANNVAVALQHASFNKDNTQNLSKVYTSPEQGAYPISSYSYMIAPTNSIEADRGHVLGTFILYFACQGQTEAERLGYSPLPPTLVANVWAAESKIKGAPSHPTKPTSQNCADPTFHGFKPDSGDTGGVTKGDGSTTDTASDTTGDTAATDASSTGASTDGETITASATASTDVLPSSSMASLQALAAQEIDGARSGVPTAVVFLIVLILALVFGPLFLRLHGGRKEGDEPE